MYENDRTCALDFLTDKENGQHWHWHSKNIRTYSTGTCTHTEKKLLAVYPIPNMS